MKRTVAIWLAGSLFGVASFWIFVAYALDYQKISPINYVEAARPVFEAARSNGRNATSLSIALNPCGWETSELCDEFTRLGITPPIRIVVDEEKAREILAGLESR